MCVFCERREILGLWISENEGVKFWLGSFTEMIYRGMQDIDSKFVFILLLLMKVKMSSLLLVAWLAALESLGFRPKILGITVVYWLPL